MFRCRVCCTRVCVCMTNSADHMAHMHAYIHETNTSDHQKVLVLYIQCKKICSRSMEPNNAGWPRLKKSKKHSSTWSYLVSSHHPAWFPRSLVHVTLLLSKRLRLQFLWLILPLMFPLLNCSPSRCQDRGTQHMHVAHELTCLQEITTNIIMFFVSHSGPSSHACMRGSKLINTLR